MTQLADARRHSRNDGLVQPGARKHDRKDDKLIAAVLDDFERLAREF
jgi:hypothetical protein